MTPQTTNVTVANGDVLKSKQDGLISTAIVPPPAAVDKAVMLDAALAYARRGWHVFPCHTPRPDGKCDCGKRDCQHIAKHPRWEEVTLEHGFKDATTDPAVIRAWWERWPTANVAIATGAKSGIEVVDPDGEEGLDDLAKLEATHGRLPDTPTELTPGGGKHLFFKYEPGKKNTTDADATSIDLKTDGGYVVVAPSLHKVGRRYAWELSAHPDDLPLADMPAWLRAIFPDKNAPRPAAITSTTTGTQTTTTTESIPEGRRNSTLTSKAGTMHRRDMSPAAITAALWLENVEKCKPPLDRSEVERIVASVTRYAPAAPSNGVYNAPDLPPLVLADLDAPPEDPEAETILHLTTTRPARTDQVLHPAITATNGTGKTTWTVAELAATIFPDPKWAVPGILPVGLCILAGRPKVGKSWLALQIAHAVGTGGRVLDQTVERGRVLFLALEDNPRRLKERTTKQGIPGTADVVFRTDFKLHDGGLADLITEIAGGGYSLVVLDTLTRALGGRADQSDEAAMTPVMSALQKIAFDHDCCVLLIDHHRKTGVGGADVIDSVLGSTTKTGHSDAILGLFKERGKSGAVLKITGRDVEERELALTWDTLTWSWQLVGNVTDLTLTERRQEILAALQQLGTATLTAISNATGQQKGNANHRLQDMVNAGLIWRKTVDKEIVYMLPHTE